MSSTIRFVFAFLAVTSCTGINPCGAGERPNVLYIMSDDHAAHAISAYGSRLAKIAPTPNIDRLAKEGALFSNAFCTNSICSPSRACVLTGQYNHVNGSFDLGGSVQPGKQMLAIEMGKADLDAASDFLADKPYFLGQRPSSLDATAFGFLGVSVYVQGDNPLFNHAASLPNLVAYCERMRAQFFPETLEQQAA